MKILITCFFLCSTQLFCQSYLNIHYTNGTDNSMLIKTVQKITFNSSGDQVNFYLTNAPTFIENIIGIKRITFEENPVPVELSYFSASVNGTSVILMWSTETEVTNYGFEIERTSVSTTGAWEKIGFVQGHGNSNSPKEYSFTDSPHGGTKFQYRLKQIDTNNKYRYSTTINVELGNPSQFEVKQNFPNPFNPSTIIEYLIPNAGNVDVNIYDISGQLVKILENNFQNAGSYKVSWDSKNNDGQNVASGIYLFQVKYNQTVLTKKIMFIK